MKKIYLFLTVAAIFASTLGYSQIQRNYYIIGGQLTNLNLGFQKGGTNFSLNVTPRVAWFVQDNFAIGGEVLLGLNTSKGFRQFNYGIGPIARYYFPDTTFRLMRRSRFFLDANIGFYGQNSKSSGESTVSTNGMGFGIGPGLAFILNPNITLEGLVKYNFTSDFTNAPDVNKNSNALRIGIGFQIHLPRAKLRQLRNEVRDEKNNQDRTRP